LIAHFIQILSDQILGGDVIAPDYLILGKAVLEILMGDNRRQLGNLIHRQNRFWLLVDP
jgi:hypothetical protein